MNLPQPRLLTKTIFSGRRFIWSALLVLSCLFFIGTSPALASLNDDHFDGNIFVLYGGNGSLVPPKVTLAESIKRDRPTLLVYYIDDSKDCKQYATVVSRIQAFYGRAADLIPVNVDAMPPKPSYAKTETGYYYSGVVPQVVVLNQSGEVVLNKKGQVRYEDIDDTFRELFNLLPRAVSPDLKIRAVNEFNTELTK